MRQCTWNLQNILFLINTVINFSDKVFTKCNHTAGKYADACLDAAKECGTKSVDFYGSIMKHEVRYNIECPCSGIYHLQMNF